MAAPLVVVVDDGARDALDDPRLHAPHTRAFFAESTDFRRAYPSVPLCGPSRLSIWASAYPPATGVWGNDAPNAFGRVRPEDTLPALLRQAGHRVGLFGKVFHGGPFDSVTNAIVADIFVSDESEWGGPAYQREIPEGSHGDDANTAAAVAAMQAEPDMVVFAGLFRPHADHAAPSRFWAMYRDQIEAEWGAERVGEWMERFPSTLPTGVPDLAAFVEGYYASFTATDELFGQLREVARAQGRPVVLISDHGYHLGSHNRLHKMTAFEPGLRSMFAIHVPGAPARVVDEAVALVDVAPTVLGLMGIPVPHYMVGVDLAPYWTDPNHKGLDATGSWVFGVLSYVEAGFRYTVYPQGQPDFTWVGEGPLDMSLQSCADRLRDIQRRARAWFTNAGFSDDAGYVVVRGLATEGGPEDTTYFVHNKRVQITDGGGQDTVYTVVDFNLPEGIERLIADPRVAGLTLTGNDIGNYLWGGTAIHGGGGDDTIVSGRATTTVTGGDGNDTIALSGTAEAVDGGAGDDSIAGWSGPDSVAGGDGNDTIAARAGDDTVDGGAGDDVIHAGPGNDTLIGGPGNDTLIGGPGADMVTTGDGDDTVLLDGDDVVDASGTGARAFRIVGPGDVVVRGITGPVTLRGAVNPAPTVVGGDLVMEHDGGSIRFVGFTGVVDLL